MKKKYDILISVDSVCDLPRELYLNLPLVIVPYVVITKYGRFKDNIEIDSRGILTSMEDPKYEVEATSPLAHEYRQYFNEFSAMAEHVIHLNMGTHVGTGYTCALEAAKVFDNVTIYDTGQISSGIGLIALKAATMARNKESLEDICNAIEELIKLTSSSFIVRDLEHMVRGHRVSARAKKICERLLLRPKLVMKDRAIKVGAVYYGKWAHVVDKYVKGCLKNPASIDKEVLFITHSGMTASELEYIKAMAERLVKFERIFIVNAGSAISCNCGIGTFGLLFAKNNDYPIAFDVEDYSAADVGDEEILNEVNSIMAKENRLYGDAGLEESDDYTSSDLMDDDYYEDEIVDEVETDDDKAVSDNKASLEVKKESKAEADADSQRSDDSENADEASDSADSSEGLGTIDKLKNIEGLETDVGLKYCMGNEEFYIMVVKEYIKKDKSETLDECLKSEDVENYRVAVHALKSTSLNIGAKELSEEAKALEMACKEGDFDTVKNGHEALMSNYRAMYESLTKAVN
ncbi:MAG: DegV family EDD domain-containing protein [Lachnospiraceae bacterium]|nr:DegV family EDD domain-containing protein [Lachnospiraceae bacterium]